jgi:CelD/BcsL family acetyltransferase involved in cellulose biosynthesis
MIESITTLDGFKRLAADWRELQRRSSSGCFFLTWEWLFTWWKHLSSARRLMILVVRQHGRVTAIAPFAVRPVSVSRLVPYRAVELLGTGSVGSDYLDLIVERGSETEAIQEIARHLEALRLPLEMTQVLMDGSSARLLAESLAPRGWQVSTARTNVCPFIRLTGMDWTTYAASLGRAHRANLHRRIRGLQRIDSLRIEPVRSAEEKRMALTRLITLHNDRRRLGGSNAFNTQEMVLFHQEISTVALDNGWLRLMVLRVGEAPVAYFYGFRHETIHYFYQSAFDPAWQDHSVGLVAMGLAIRSAIEEGAAEFDMLHGAEPYKYHWAHEERAIGRVEIHPPFLRGRLTSGSAVVGRAARAMGRSLLRSTGAGSHA